MSGFGKSDIFIGHIFPSVISPNHAIIVCERLHFSMDTKSSGQGLCRMKLPSQGCSWLKGHFTVYCSTVVMVPGDKRQIFFHPKFPTDKILNMPGVSACILLRNKFIKGFVEVVIVKVKEMMGIDKTRLNSVPGIELIIKCSSALDRVFV